MRVDIKNLEKIGRATALKSKMRQKVSAIGLIGNKIVATSHNYRVFNIKNKLSIHAEEALLIKSKPQIMFIYRALAKGPGTSKPCDRCRHFINISNVKIIIYFNGTTFVEERI